MKAGPAILSLFALLLSDSSSADNGLPVCHPELNGPPALGQSCSIEVRPGSHSIVLRNEVVTIPTPADGSRYEFDITVDMKDLRMADVNEWVRIASWEFSAANSSNQFRLALDVSSTQAHGAQPMILLVPIDIIHGDQSARAPIAIAGAGMCRRLEFSWRPADAHVIDSGRLSVRAGDTDACDSGDGGFVVSERAQFRIAGGSDRIRVGNLGITSTPAIIDRGVVVTNIFRY